MRTVLRSCKKGMHTGVHCKVPGVTVTSETGIWKTLTLSCSYFLSLALLNGLLCWSQLLWSELCHEDTWGETVGLLQPVVQEEQRPCANSQETSPNTWVNSAEESFQRSCDVCSPRWPLIIVWREDQPNQTLEHRNNWNNCPHGAPVLSWV